MLCFDGDSAGQKAAIRAAHRALPLLQPGRSLSFVTLPEGMDPDDLVRTKGPKAFEALLERPQALSDRIWAHEVAAEPLDTPEARAGLKRRLGELANSIAEPSVRTEYIAEFRRRFDVLFEAPPRQFRPRGDYKKGKWKPPEPPIGQALRGVQAGGLDPILARAVIAGLIRHPAEIARHMEVLGSLRSASGALGRLFEAVINVALEDHALDSARILTILARSGFGEIANELLRADGLSYSFNLAEAKDEERARQDLDEAISVMVARPVVDAALAEATAALQERFTDEAFARQTALWRKRQELDTRLANLAVANEDDFDD
jgi:DNA primase